MYLNRGVVLNEKGGGSELSPDPWFRYTAYNCVLIYGAGLLKHNPTIMYDTVCYVVHTVMVGVGF
jgi:hypothetical protein